MSLKKEKILEFILASVLILIGGVLRLMPHPPNFAPIEAMALFGGVYFRKKVALIFPLAAMFISDFFIGFYDPALMTTVYGSFILTVLLGFWLKKNKKWYTVEGTAILSAILFFVLTNFAVWAFSPWYPKNISGLIECYILAIPFFKNTLWSNLFYVSLFFGAYEIVDLWIRERYLSLSRPKWKIQKL